MRPEFFTDSTMAALSPAVRLTYIGLWLVADDAGWLRWDVPQIGAVLYPFESVKRREASLMAAKEALERTERIRWHDCGCAQIPTLERHQRIAGNRSFQARDAHRAHTGSNESLRGATSSPVTVGNVKVGKGRVEPLQVATSEDDGLRDSYRKLGLPVDAA